MITTRVAENHRNLSHERGGPITNMTTLTEEPPVVSRPISKSEQKDIVAETKALLAKVENYTKINLRDREAGELAACKDLVYACFGFKLMRARFAHLTNGPWHAFLNKTFPREFKYVSTYLAIGNHFSYDEKYLTFLDEIKYKTAPAERRVRSIASQLKALNLTTTFALMQDFDPRHGKHVPEPCNDETPTTKDQGHRTPESAKEWKPISMENGLDALGSYVDTRPASPIIPKDKDSISENRNSQKPEDPIELLCTKLMDKIISRVSGIYAAKNSFNTLLTFKSVGELDPSKIKQLRSALLSAQEILNRLPKS